MIGISFFSNINDTKKERIYQAKLRVGFCFNSEVFKVFLKKQWRLLEIFNVWKRYGGFVIRLLQDISIKT